MKASISKRVGRRGTVWTAVIDMPRDPVTDKRRQKRLTAPTKKEVEALAAQFIANMLNGGFAEAEATKITVNEYLTQWLNIAAQNLKPSSHRRYSEMTKKYYRPHLGKLQLSKLSGLHIQAFYAERLAAGLSPTTVNMLHNILHRALKQAVRLRLIVSNPIDMVDAPRKATQEMKAWDARQTAAFLAASDRHDWAALWRLAITSGMRRGELLALRWEDIDWQQSALSVRRTLSRGATGGYEFGAPKTQAGKRRVELAQSVMAILHAHRIKQIEARLAVGSAYQDQGLVFADKIGNPIHPNTMRVHFRKLIEEAGVPYIRLHDMRHTHATLMLANGENPKIVSERLGHSSIGITLDRYSHVTPAMQREAANRLDRLIEGAS